MGTISLCMLTPSQTNISKFISNDYHLTMLENQCNAMHDLKKIHAHLVKTGLSKHPIAISRVLAFTATSPAADINYAYSIFSRIHNPNLFMWNAIIRGFSQSSVPQNAILLFMDMLNSSTIELQRLTYPSLFKAYAQLGLPDYGAQLHGRIIKLGLEFDPFVRNTIIHMYANSGSLSEAYKLFDREEDFDVVAWNSLIMGLAKKREIDEARRLFNKMGLKRNAISWNIMISGYVRNDKFTKAMELFERMQDEGIKAYKFTMVSLLNACANLGSLGQGDWIYHYTSKNRFEFNVLMTTAIVDMYCKCGAINKARRFFEKATIKGLSSWNSMIFGLANNGCEEEAFQLFSQLISSSEPNDVTFLGVLTACINKGDVKQARELFLLMSERYKLKPSIKHYNCMVEVLGQEGFLNEAEQLIREMSIEADAIIWGSLLSSCRKHGNIEMAERAGNYIREIDPNDSSAYILVSNVYAASGQFKQAIKQRIEMKEKQVLKEKGCSSIEINGEVQEFTSGRMSNPEVQDLMNLLYTPHDDEKLTEEVNL
ncbi:pentatricopeptide repeat-containing protein At2g42920, chloroplastic-like [Chenopodium quinoa]|uniref:pentatricopeptide repeat-containing protein At2g42920, chloroplastic-like n=1 Tax=Chenopodium quinoa TaxID=63459 RepID=UPI000B770242|nr:pentatricopeptide repeat-containing protein At2g42920, chloroplastic-like [Chenopodium quinoa]